MLAMKYMQRTSLPIMHSHKSQHGTRVTYNKGYAIKIARNVTQRDALYASPQESSVLAVDAWLTS
jgi:hypothetical protein